MQRGFPSGRAHGRSETLSFNVTQVGIVPVLLLVETSGEYGTSLKGNQIALFDNTTYSL